MVQELLQEHSFNNCLLSSEDVLAAKSLQSCPTLCDPIDGSHQAPPSLGFSRQEHWSGLPFPSPGCARHSAKWGYSKNEDNYEQKWLLSFREMRIQKWYTEWCKSFLFILRKARRHWRLLNGGLTWLVVCMFCFVLFKSPKHHEENLVENLKIEDERQKKGMPYSRL